MPMFKNDQGNGIFYDVITVHDNKKRPLAPRTLVKYVETGTNGITLDKVLVELYELIADQQKQLDELRAHDIVIGNDPDDINFPIL